MDSAISNMAQASVAQTAGTGALLGVLFHLSIMKIEFESIMYHFMALSTLSFFGLMFTFLKFDYTVLGAFARTSLFFTAFNTGLMSSIAIYRLFFHRTRSFPGPVGMKLSRFYAAYLNAKNYQFYKELEAMHETYGDFVRTGPREISILDKAAIPLIYGPNSECRKASWYTQGGNDPTKCAVNMIRDGRTYRLRRRAWDRGLANKAVTTYEPRVKAKTDVFIEQLRKNEGRPMDITAWTMFLGFDVMGDIGFGKDFSNLTSGIEHPAIAQIHKHMSILGVFQTLPWLMNILGSIPGAASSFAEFFEFCAKQMQEKKDEYSPEKNPKDVASWLVKAVIEKDVSASPTPQSLADDSRSLIIAGSDTTANTLALMLFYLTTHPQKLKKLQSLIDIAIPDGPSSWTYEAIRTVTYIDDIINEALRLKPPVIHGGPRETPATGLHIGNVYIPGNVTVSVPYLLIQRDPRWWKEAESFVPERFGERRIEMGTDEAPWLPFTLGTHACAGKGLAYMILRTSLSLIVQNFDVSFAPGETGETFDKEFLDTFLLALPPLKLVFLQEY